MAATPEPTSPQIINDVEPRSQYVAVAGQTVFNTNWTANSSTDVVVYFRTQYQEADDQTQVVSTTDYNVEFVGTYETVRVTFLEPLDLGDIVTIVRDTPASRTNLYTNTNFVPAMLNQDFGILTLVDQQNQMYDQDFCPHYNLSATYTDGNDLAIDLILPILGANQFWVKNEQNSKIIAIDLPGPENLPINAPFVTYTADASLANAQNLGALTAGILSQTVTDGIATIGVLDIPMTVPNGGTGATTFTAHSVILAGTTATGALRNVSGVGVSGQVLTSQGPGQDPIWSIGTQVGAVNTVEFLSGGTYTKPSNLLFAIIECVGGGGGGAGTGNSGATGVLIVGGGGSGGYSRSVYNAEDIGATETVTIGSAGTAAAAGANAGGSGGQTSVGALCVANGGSGGPSSALGGAGAIAGTGNSIAAPGNNGLPGVLTSLNTTTFAAGAGANSMWGAGGQSNGGTATGATASGYGAGGAGGASANAGGAAGGGAGTQGRVLITEYLAA